MSEQWQPLHEAHAIRNVTVGFRFAEPLPSRAWNRTVQSARQIAERQDLLTTTELKVLDVEVASEGQPSATETVAGYEFLRLETPTFYAEKLRITPNELWFDLWRYKGWDVYKKRCHDLIEPLTDSYINNIQLVDIFLEYTDRFVAPGDVATPFGELIVRGSPYVVPHVEKVDGVWESKAAFFDLSEEAYVRLIKCNLKFFRETTNSGELRRGVVDLSSRAEVRVQTPEQERLFEQGFVESAIFSGMHDATKQYLAKILTDQQAKRIRLFNGIDK